MYLALRGGLSPSEAKKWNERTSVKSESGIETQEAICPDDVSDSLKSSRNLGNVYPPAGSYGIL
jgi:hypothetical protein